MNLRPIKASLAAIVGSIFVMTALQAYADTTGADLFALAQSKVNQMVAGEIAQTGINLDNERQNVENQIYDYVDGYIKGIQSELDAYTKEQESAAKDSLDINYNNVKKVLDNQREELITNAKAQISQTISSQLQNEQNQLNNDINNEIVKKFK